MASKPNEEIIEIIKRFIKEISKNNIKIEKAFLFGSHAKGTATEWSDIDVALVSDDFIGIRFYDNIELAKYKLKIDNRLETHPYRASEFNVDSRWFVQEILDNGIEIEV